jgi:hypothetical protein
MATEMIDRAEAFIRHLKWMWSKDRVERRRAKRARGSAMLEEMASHIGKRDPRWRDLPEMSGDREAIGIK